MTQNYTTHDRQHWISVLSRADYSAIESLWERIDIQESYTTIREPEIGMAQVRGRFSNKGNRFNVGDVTITRASVALDSGEVGHCYMVGRHKDKAVLCAYLDGVLQMDAYRDTVMAQLITPLHDAYLEHLKNQKQDIETSKVDFFTMAREN